MGRNGKGEGGSSECCMCGDYGLSSQLVTCIQCRFRSQHKYCSNLYPEAESYLICNWCLITQKNDKKGEGDAKSGRPNYTASHDEKPTKMNSIKRVHGADLEGNHIKKDTAFRADRTGPARGKRIVGRRMLNGGVVIKQVYRNKVRRYKFLDEVLR